MDVTFVNPCPAEPEIILFEICEDSDQLASVEASGSGSTLFYHSY